MMNRDALAPNPRQHIISLYAHKCAHTANRIKYNVMHEIRRSFGSVHVVWIYSLSDRKNIVPFVYNHPVRVKHILYEHISLL